MSIVVDEHRELLADGVRLSAFRQAIGEVVWPGAIVADIGSGSGILGLLACEAGAARVYSIEQGGIIELARAVSKANGFADRQRFVAGLSTLIELPEQVDVLVADQIGHFGFEAGLFEYCADARRRFLKRGGVMIPSSIELRVAAVEATTLFDRIQFWSRRPGGFDFEPVQGWAVNTGYPTVLDAAQVISDEAAAMVEMTSVTTEPLNLQADLRVIREGMMHGLGGWFVAQLSSRVSLTNSPMAPARIGRRNVFLPIARPVAVAPGDGVSLAINIRPGETIVTWNVGVWAGNRREAASKKGEFSHSTLRGMLIGRDDLRRMDPRFVPVLTERGRARLGTLELCAGHCALAEIEEEMFRRHPALFGSKDDAAAFVAEVVTRYTK